VTRASGRAVVRIGLFLLAATVSTAACQQSSRAEPPINWSWTIDPAAPVVGPATLTIGIRKPSGDPIDGAVVRLEAHMSHPGMAPVLASATGRATGTYDIPFTFTMRGDWVLLVTIDLPDGQRAERRIDVANVRTAS
jgi:hypothetical protein